MFRAFFFSLDMDFLFDIHSKFLLMFFSLAFAFYFKNKFYLKLLKFVLLMRCLTKCLTQMCLNVQLLIFEFIGVAFGKTVHLFESLGLVP